MPPPLGPCANEVDPQKAKGILGRFRRVHRGILWLLGDLSY